MGRTRSVEPRRAHAVEPTFGIGNADLVPVLGGLESGDEIIISNLNLISDGQLIQRKANDSRG